MITPQQFRDACDRFTLEFGLWQTSGRRTDEHSKSLPGGFAGDPHAWGAGVDCLPLPLPDRTRHEMATRAAELGLLLLFESDHMHLNPLGWPVGPVTVAPDPSWEGLHSIPTPKVVS